METPDDETCPGELRLLVADDHAVVRAGLVALLHGHGGMSVVFEASDGAEAVRGWQARRPDVCLIDLGMPVLDGLQAVAAIRRLDDQARIVVMTAMHGGAEVHRALKAGANGYLFKDCGRLELAACIRDVASGRRYLQAEAAAQLAEHASADELTPRETDVMRCMAEGLTNKAIGRRLGLADGTVRTHMKRVLAKLEAGSRTEALRAAFQRGLVRL